MAQKAIIAAFLMVSILMSNGFRSEVEACRYLNYVEDNVQVSSIVVRILKESGVRVTRLHGNPFEVEHIRDEDFVRA